MGGTSRGAAILALALATMLAPTASAGVFYHFDRAPAPGDYLDLPTGAVVSTDGDVPHAPMDDPAGFVRVDVYGASETTSLTSEDEACPSSFCVGADVRLVQANDVSIEISYTDACGPDRTYTFEFPADEPAAFTYLNGDAHVSGCQVGVASAKLAASAPLLAGLPDTVRASYTASDAL